MTATTAAAAAHLATITEICVTSLWVSLYNSYAVWLYFVYIEFYALYARRMFLFRYGILSSSAVMRTIYVCVCVCHRKCSFHIFAALALDAMSMISLSLCSNICLSLSLCEGVCVPIFPYAHICRTNARTSTRDTHARTHTHINTRKCSSSTYRYCLVLCACTGVARCYPIHKERRRLSSSSSSRFSCWVSLVAEFYCVRCWLEVGWKCLCTFSIRSTHITHF